MAIVMSLVEHFSINYLTEEEETSIISMWPALPTRLVRQKAISPNDVFSNLLASRPHNIKDCLILLDLMLTSTPSTARCEPGFSATNHLKCNLRTTQFTVQFSSVYFCHFNYMYIYIYIYINIQIMKFEIKWRGSS